MQKVAIWTPVKDLAMRARPTADPELRDAREKFGIDAPLFDTAKRLRYRRATPPFVARAERMETPRLVVVRKAWGR